MKSLCDTRCVTTTAGVQLARTDSGAAAAAAEGMDWNGSAVRGILSLVGRIIMFYMHKQCFAQIALPCQWMPWTESLGECMPKWHSILDKCHEEVGLRVRVEWVGILHNTNNKIREFHMLSHSLRIVVTHQDCIESHCIASAGDQEWNKVVIEASRFQEIVPKMIIRHWMKWRCRCRIINIYLFVFVKRAGDWKQFPGNWSQLIMSWVAVKRIEWRRRVNAISLE